MLHVQRHNMFFAHNNGKCMFHFVVKSESWDIIITRCTYMQVPRAVCRCTVCVCVRVCAAHVCGAVLVPYRCVTQRDH